MPNRFTAFSSLTVFQVVTTQVLQKLKALMVLAGAGSAGSAALLRAAARGCRWHQTYIASANNSDQVRTFAGQACTA